MRHRGGERVQARTGAQLFESLRATLHSEFSPGGSADWLAQHQGCGQSRAGLLEPLKVITAAMTLLSVSSMKTQSSWLCSLEVLAQDG